jgi:hypothetical protein
MIKFIGRSISRLSPRLLSIAQLLVGHLLFLLIFLIGASLAAYPWIGGDFNWSGFKHWVVIATCVLGFGSIVTIVLENVLLLWAGRDETSEFVSARVVAVLCGIAPFFAHWSGRDNGGFGWLIGATNLFLWAAAIAVGAHRLRDWLSRLSPIWFDKSMTLILVHSAATLVVGAMHLLWAEGVRLVHTPMVDLNNWQVVFMWFLLILPPLVIGGITWLVFGRTHFRQDNGLGEIVEGIRNDFPMLSWSQERGTGSTVASKDGQGRFKLWIGLIALGAIIGLSTGRIENMFLGAFMAGWLGAFGLRGAGSIKMGEHSMQSIPYTPTAADRREEMTPVTQREDCEVFLRDLEGVIYFVVARGDKRKGTLPLVDAVPWESFGNFEEGSHRHWFRERGAPSDLVDWGVIVAQSNIGRVLGVAESVHSQAWLVELLVKLQNTFIAPRDKIMQDLREAAQKRRAHDETDLVVDAPDSNDAPTRTF